jgi:ribosomal protein L11 methyltransferase
MDKKKRKEGGKIWHKVTMSVSKDDADMVRRAIQSYHCCGIQEEDEAAGKEHLDAYFDGAVDLSELRKHMEVIAELISAAAGRKLKLGSIEAVPEEDWLEEWRKNWKPVRITKTLVVCPSWEKFPARPEEKVIYIYPKMAFGTGSHPTTKLCLKLLERYMERGASVVDIGSGSGILAIGAAKFGARRVVAYEMDQAAIENGWENCTFNRVRSKVKLIHDSFDPRARGRFDLGVCNMLGHIMQPLIGDMDRVVTGTALILSGLTVESADGIRRELRNRDWRIKKTLKDGEWIGLYAVRDMRT